MDDLEVRQLLADLTVVILTRNRPGYLQGVVKYWASWPVSLIVLDGSDRPVDELLLDAGEANLIGYSAVPINDRLNFAASRIDTPFACLHSDDDFTLARGAAKAIAWLQANPEITCVASDVLLFSEDRTSGLGPPGRTVISVEPDQRMAVHFSDYRFAYFYGIQRSRQLSIALTAVAAATDCPEFIGYPNVAAGYELGIEICGAALGRLSNSPDVLLLKRVGNESRTAENQESNEWLEDPKAQSAVRAWRLILAHYLAPHLDVSEVTVDGWIAEALSLFCKLCQRDTLEQQKRERSKNLVGKVARVLKPKNSMLYDSRPATRLAHIAHAISYQAIRVTFRATMKTIGRPRPKALTLLSKLDRADLQDVVSILDGNFDK